MRLRDVRVNERTRLTLNVSFNTESGGGAPASARWKAYCDTTCTSLTDWASLSVDVDGAAEIEIPASVTRIIDRCNSVERKLIAIEANPDTDDQVSTEQVIVVENLKVTE